MKQKFSRAFTKDVTLTRGEESITLTLHPLPVGYRGWLQDVFPPPTLYVNGKPQQDETSFEYWNLFTCLVLARALEPSGVLDSTRPADGAGRDLWQNYACLVREEFRAANLTDGDWFALTKALNELEGANPEARKDAGNA